jgi:outer membrane biosynthesis protein TonB
LARAKALADPVTMPIRRDNAATGFLLSVVLHAAIIGSFYLSWPFLKRETPIQPPLIVDLVPIDEITAAPPPPAPKAEEEPKPETQPVPPKPDEASPPEEMPPEPEKPKPEPPKPEPPKPEPEKPPPPVTPPPPPKPEPPKPKKNEMVALDKLLKDLQKKQPQKPQSQATPAAPSQATGNQAAAVSDRATMTELDAIRHHFESCWRIDPGKEGIENLSAVIRVFIGLDGSVQKAEIEDMSRYFADPQFRTFANSARIAVLGCSGVPITPEHYEQLKDMELNFSPQGRIN